MRGQVLAIGLSRNDFHWTLNFDDDLHDSSTVVVDMGLCPTMTALLD